MLGVDLNCDLGEGFPFDRQLMAYISSANIACGIHAGDADSMRQAVGWAMNCGVAIGAHPSFPGKKNFGRADLNKEQPGPEDLYSILYEQISTLQKICTDLGARLHHVKPHGALYNRAAKDRSIGNCICSVVQKIDPTLQIYGLSGSEMKTASESYHLKFINEVFADRTYQEDGGLTKREEGNGLIKDTGVAVEQVLQMVLERTVTALNGKKIPVHAETICIHGDEPKAPEFALAIREALLEEGFRIEKPSDSKWT